MGGGGTLAAEAGLKVDYIRKKNFRKQDRVKAVIEQRGDQAGLVWCARHWIRARPISRGTTNQAALPSCDTATAFLNSPSPRPDKISCQMRQEFHDLGTEGCQRPMPAGHAGAAEDTT